MFFLQQRNILFPKRDNSMAQYTIYELRVHCHCSIKLNHTSIQKLKVSIIYPHKKSYKSYNVIKMIINGHLSKILE
jgi:hypothetical protein